MPTKLETALKRAADKRGLKGKDRNAFIYGVMRKRGWKPNQSPIQKAIAKGRK